MGPNITSMSVKISVAAKARVAEGRLYFEEQSLNIKEFLTCQANPVIFRREQNFEPT
jgi:hypothetical protein